MQTAGAALGAKATFTLKNRQARPMLATVTAVPMVGDRSPRLYAQRHGLDAAGSDHVEVVVNGGRVQLATLGVFSRRQRFAYSCGLCAENGRHAGITLWTQAGNRSLRQPRGHLSQPSGRLSRRLQTAACRLSSGFPHSSAA